MARTTLWQRVFGRWSNYSDADRPQRKRLGRVRFAAQDPTRPYHTYVRPSGERQMRCACGGTPVLEDYYPEVRADLEVVFIELGWPKCKRCERAEKRLARERAEERRLREKAKST